MELDYREAFVDQTVALRRGDHGRVLGLGGGVILCVEQREFLSDDVRLRRLYVTKREGARDGTRGRNRAWSA